PARADVVRARHPVVGAGRGFGGRLGDASLAIGGGIVRTAGRRDALSPVAARVDGRMDARACRAAILRAGDVVVTSDRTADAATRDARIVGGARLAVVAGGAGDRLGAAARHHVADGAGTGAGARAERVDRLVHAADAGCASIDGALDAVVARYHASRGTATVG